MPKWLIAFASGALAGVVGFACGGLLTSADRQAAESIVSQAQEAQHEAESLVSGLQADNKKLNAEITQKKKRISEFNRITTELRAKIEAAYLPKTVFLMQKKQFLYYCNIKGLPQKKEQYGVEGQTELESDGPQEIRVQWIEVDGRQHIKNIVISHTMVEHTLEAAKPILALWSIIEPDIVPFFAEAFNEMSPHRGQSKLKKYKDSPYVYGISQNNKYYIQVSGD